MLEPSSCHPRAIQQMEAASDCLDSTAGLVRAATAIALHVQPNLRPHEVERTIAAYADAVAARIPRIARGPRPLPPQDVEIAMAHLHFVLFEEAGFTGNTAAYYDPRNSLLHDVLVRRLGIPISLALVYKAVGELVGLRIHGVDTPLHFLVEVETGEPGGRRTFVDAFGGGRLLWEDEVLAAAARCTGQPVSEVLIRRADHRAWVARMIRNLEAIFANAGRHEDLQAMQELATVAGVRV